MTTHAGKEGLVKIGINTIAEVNGWSIDESIAVADSTSLDNVNGWKTHKQTWKEWSGKVDCWWDPSNTNGQNALVLGASVTIGFFANGDQTGDIKYSGVATVTSISKNIELEGLVKASFSFTGNGILNSTIV